MKRKIIIDCDPGIDDSLAIMMALTSKEIEVLGITIVCGNADRKSTRLNSSHGSESRMPSSA